MESTLPELVKKFRETTAALDKLNRAAARDDKSASIRYNLLPLEDLRFKLESDLMLFPLQQLEQYGLGLGKALTSGLVKAFGATPADGPETH